MAAGAAAAGVASVVAMGEETVAGGGAFSGAPCPESPPDSVGLDILLLKTSKLGSKYQNKHASICLFADKLAFLIDIASY